MNINVFLIRLLKFITFALFLFAMLVYAGAFVLLPLDILFQLTRVFQGFGMPVVMALLASGGVLGYVGVKLRDMPGLYQLVWDIGVQLITFGRGQISRYDELLAGYQPEAAASE